MNRVPLLSPTAEEECRYLRKRLDAWITLACVLFVALAIAVVVLFMAYGEQRVKAKKALAVTGFVVCVSLDEFKAVSARGGKLEMKVKAKYLVELACSKDVARPELANPYLHADSATPCLAAFKPLADVAARQLSYDKKRRPHEHFVPAGGRS